MVILAFHPFPQSLGVTLDLVLPATFCQSEFTDLAVMEYSLVMLEREREGGRKDRRERIGREGGVFLLFHLTGLSSQK